MASIIDLDDDELDSTLTAVTRRWHAALRSDVPPGDVAALADTVRQLDTEQQRRQHPL